MSNGLEIWDALDRYDKATQKIRAIHALDKEISSVGTTCGDCDHWMKSKQCPRERNVNGYNRGPSCADTPCSSFAESSTATARRVALLAKQAAL